MAITIVRNFLRLEAASGILLLVAAVLALIVCNTPYDALYQAVLQKPFILKIGTPIWHVPPLLFWVNDGLMALFFLLVGLELKREFIAGELAGAGKVLLPALAAFGGMLIPALIYVYVNYHSPQTQAGWAIPVATDIAFAVGVLSLFGKRIPISLKIFLMTLAIFDDLGAILIIALCYSHSISFKFLSLACVILALLWGLNRWQVRRLWPYLTLGILLWLFVLKSGVHASVSGVLLALLIPFKKKAGAKNSPLSYLEHALHPWVAYLIMPLFAFANAGLSFQGMTLNTLFAPVTLGIVAGLVIGKQTGVFGLVFIFAKMRWLLRPERSSWLELYGVALLCGMGFTMSLFLGTLAFQYADTVYLTEVRLGVLMGSVISGALGSLVLCFAIHRKRKGGPTFV